MIDFRSNITKGLIAAACCALAIAAGALSARDEARAAAHHQTAGHGPL